MNNNERPRARKNRIKTLFSDSVLSIMGLVTMNVVAQFIVYPTWRGFYSDGGETYGNILYLISIMNILAVSMGVSCSYQRMTASASGKTRNTPYIVILVISSMLGVDVAVASGLFAGVDMSFADITAYAVLMCLTMWRYYADVEFKLSLNYKGYFLYYFFISLGYGLGILLFRSTGIWALALIPGELFGLAYVFLRGKTLRTDGNVDLGTLRDISRTVLLLFGSEVMSTVVFNGDRLVLKLFIDGSAVTIYYIASLLGKTAALLVTPLNGVIVGYLARYRGKLTLKIMNLILGGSVAVALLGGLACTLGSKLIIPYLYPEDYVSAVPYFFIANISQVIYFTANVITVVLLRFSRARYQIYVNVAFAAAFVLLCMPLTYFLGFKGFSAGLLAACLIRFITSIALGYRDAFRVSRQMAEAQRMRNDRPAGSRGER